MRFTIKAKLGIAFGVVLLLLGGAGYLAVSSLSGYKRSDAGLRGPSVHPGPARPALRVDVLDAARMFARSMLERPTRPREKLFADFRAHDAKFPGRPERLHRSCAAG